MYARIISTQNYEVFSYFVREAPANRHGLNRSFLNPFTFVFFLIVFLAFLLMIVYLYRLHREIVGQNSELID